jgi:cytochrome c-type biogenesis protein CcmH/NrfF
VASLLPLAHAGHWISWVLFLPPALIVLGSALWSTVSERRKKRSD